MSSRNRLAHVALWLVLLSIPQGVLAQSDWRGHVGILAVKANGAKQLERPNGKTVSTDIGDSGGIKIGIQYNFRPRLGIAFSYFGGAEHTVELRQDFPDDTYFETADNFRVNTAAIGLAFDMTPNRDIDVFIEPFIAYVSIEDVYLESAGPPFDQEAPLNLDIEDTVAVGATFGLDMPIGSGGWTFNASASLLIVGLDGTTYPNPAFPGTSSSIGLDFNPVSIGIGVGYRF